MPDWTGIVTDDDLLYVNAGIVLGVFPITNLIIDQSTLSPAHSVSPKEHHRRFFPFSSGSGSYGNRNFADTPKLERENNVH